MFFTVVIPTYNPRKYLPRLLESITRNNCADEIEIIISDDCSDESFDDVLDNFSQLSIRKIVNDKHYGFPRTGRENGAQAATGTWICFADQDDYFLDNAFDNVRKHIEENNIKWYLVCNFLNESAETGDVRIIDGAKGWTHGKFYERSFWIENGIHYADTQYCEDTSLSTIMQCLMMEKDYPIHAFNEPVYVWYRRNDSLANGDYFLRSMPDYVRVTLGKIVEHVEKHAADEDTKILDNFTILFMRTFLHCFFYLQSKYFLNNKKTTMEAIVCIQPIFERFKKAHGVTNENVINLINNGFFNLYNETREYDCKQIPFIEQISFADWLRVYF